MATVTRYVGTCPVCDARFKVRTPQGYADKLGERREGFLVLHGYKRPGFGFVVGDCYAARMAPHEQTPATAESYRTAVEAQIESVKAERGVVEVAASLTYSYRTFERKTVSVTVQEGDSFRYEGPQLIPAFDGVKKERLRGLDRQLEMLAAETKRMTQLIDTWVEQLLTTVEEEQSKGSAVKREARDARKAERDAKKAAKQARADEAARKLQLKVEALQKRMRGILDAVDPSDVRALRTAYVKVLEIKVPAVYQYGFMDHFLDRTALLATAGLVRTDGRLMSHPHEVYRLG